MRRAGVYPVALALNDGCELCAMLTACRVLYESQVGEDGANAVAIRYHARVLWARLAGLYAADTGVLPEWCVAGLQ